MSQTSTFVVFAHGPLGSRIRRTAQVQADFDPSCRRVVDVERLQLPLTTPRRAQAAAAVVNGDGLVCATLDAQQAVSAPWIEDAFVRAKRMRN